MGPRMSGVPNCATTELSTYCTMEWITLCGWITTWICAGVTPNRNLASMTSSALFIMVAESTEILRPMTQLGWAQASSGVTSRKVEGSRVRNGPPEAVKIILSMRAAQSRGSCGKDWKIAECSLSMGNKVAPPVATVSMNIRPPTTSASLLANKRRLPDCAAARQEASPAAPTIAAMTVSASSWAATMQIASAPHKT